MHKFIGGPGGSPGILVAKKNLFKNPVPQESGGGTVFYVIRFLIILINIYLNFFFLGNKIRS